MADTEESPAQRSARIRREKREAKIKTGGQDRLDKITQLSGRTPENMRSLETPIATPPRSISPAIVSPNVAPTGAASADQMRQQEEFIRAMLRGQGAQPEQGGDPVPEDPMIKMLTSMLGGMSDDPNAPNSGLPSLSSLNPDDIAKATGIPSFLTNMVMGKQATPPTAAEVKNTQLWTLLHVLFAVIGGVYMLFTVSNLTNVFGENPPAPATIQNPFVIFVTGELLLHGLKPFLSIGPQKSGPGLWLQIAKQTGRDAAVMVFLMGAYNWWHGYA